MEANQRKIEVENTYLKQDVKENNDYVGLTAA